MIISVTALHDKMCNSEFFHWIDVRTIAEYKAERPDSPMIQNVPLDEIINLDLPKDQPIFVSCLSGKRSQAAKDILISCGYTKVINVMGGLVDWKKENFPVCS